MAKKDFDANKYLELAKSLKLDSMDDINDLFKNLSKAIIENSLNAEMHEHLGYDKWDQTSRNKSNNYRKGYSNKKVKSSFGEFISKYQEMRMLCLNLHWLKNIKQIYHILMIKLLPFIQKD